MCAGQAGHSPGPPWVSARLLWSGCHELLKVYFEFLQFTDEEINTRTTPPDNLDTLMSAEMEDYRRYTKWTKFPSGIKGRLKSM